MWPFKPPYRLFLDIRSRTEGYNVWIQPGDTIDTSFKGTSSKIKLVYKKGRLTLFYASPEAIAANWQGMGEENDAARDV